MAGTPSHSQRPPYEQSVHVPLQPEKTVTSALPHQPAVFGAHGHFLECLSVQELACSGVFRQFPRYRFHATISVWVKHHNASGCWPQAFQEAAIASSSERVAMPYSRDFSAMLECNVRSA
jgi:hypothetical protein